MAHYAVRESPPLRGEIPISTSKNAVLPIMCGALLTGEDVRIERVPELTDVKTLCALLASCGCSVKKESDALVLNAGALQNPQDEEDVRKMRASVLVLGPLLSRLGEARIPLPGGCAIGQRPIDQHLKGMSALGAKVKFDHGGVTLSGRLRGAVIYLDMPSVGATENLLMAATLASGTTRIENAAKEPEIVDLAAFLNAMGARICGAGTSTIVIEGVRALHAVSWQPISDRIEAGTMACACAITGGELLLSGAREGLSTLLSIAPSLIVLLTGISMLRSSGFFAWMAQALAPVFRFFGMPPELAPLILVRPVSGSAALAVGAELMKTYGVDSLIGKTAAVMLGSTETTFYTISVYFGSAGIRDTRHTVFAALLADFTGFFMACLTTRFFLT